MVGAGRQRTSRTSSGLPSSGSNAARQLSAALGLPAVEARALQLLGVSRLELGDLPGARAALAKGVPAIADIGDRFAIPVGLSALAGLAAKNGRPRAALRLAGAAAAYEEINQTYRPQNDTRRARRLAGAGPRRRSAPRRRSCSRRDAG